MFPKIISEMHQTILLKKIYLKDSCEDPVCNQLSEDYIAGIHIGIGEAVMFSVKSIACLRCQCQLKLLLLPH